MIQKKNPRYCDIPESLCRFEPSGYKEAKAWHTWQKDGKFYPVAVVDAETGVIMVDLERRVTMELRHENENFPTSVVEAPPFKGIYWFKTPRIFVFGQLRLSFSCPLGAEDTAQVFVEDGNALSFQITVDTAAVCKHPKALVAIAEGDMPQEEGAESNKNSSRKPRAAGTQSKKKLELEAEAAAAMRLQFQHQHEQPFNAQRVPRTALTMNAREQLFGLHTLDQFIENIRVARKILVVTGAGISVSCGIPDFRSKVFTRNYLILFIY